MDPAQSIIPYLDECNPFRNYVDGALQDRVFKTYDAMHTFQTLEFAISKNREWTAFTHGEYTLMEVCKLVDQYVDYSDPDIDLPNSVHAYQTAEKIREQHPSPADEWLVFVGFVHDLGKIMGVWGEPQWCVVGDTFPLGCAFAEECVFGIKSFEKNPDFHHPFYSSRLGIYKENCGLNNLVMTWGHDEYLYQVLNNSVAAERLPPHALQVIRFHSFYPWHKENAYRQFMAPEDHELLKWVRIFQKYDLYSKSNEVPDIEKLQPYYEALIEKFCPGKLRW